MKLYVLFLHLIGASIWVGGHLVVSVRYLPNAIKNKTVSEIINFERKYEKIGMPALVLQILTGLYLAQDWTDHFRSLLDFNDPVVKVIWIKLGLLFSTFLLALDVRLRLIPKLSDKDVFDLSWHIVLVTIFGVAFVFFGLLIRHGGFSYY